MTKRLIRKQITNELIKRGNRITSPITPKVKEKGGKKEHRKNAGWNKQKANRRWQIQTQVITLNVNCINTLLKDKGYLNRKQAPIVCHLKDRP